MSQIPVVQGVAVPSGGNYHSQPAGGYHSQPAQQPTTGYVEASTFGVSGPANDNFNGVKGEKQPKQYQDAFWALLFVGHLVVMVVVMTGYSLSMQNNGNGYSYGGVAWCVTMCALVAVGLSSMALGFMMQFATELIKAALIFSVASSLLLGVVGLLSGNMWMGLLGLLCFLLGCCYACIVWGRIPVRTKVVLSTIFNTCAC